MSSAYKGLSGSAAAIRTAARITGPAILKIGIALGLALSCLLPRTALAVGQECMQNYYQTKSPACVDAILSDFRQRGRQADPNTLMGFLAQLFKTSAEERQRMLAAETSDYLKSIDLISLYRAGLSQEAETFAKANNLSAVADKIRATQLVTLDALKPSVPADNDLLVGAYMASGDTTFIQRILASYTGADDGMVSDGMRLGFMIGKFGPTLSVKGRNPATLQVACEKYQCKADPAKLLRVMTLATALWSLQALSQQDVAIKRTFFGFLARDMRLNTAFAVEQNAFANYLTTIIGLAAVPENAGLNKSAEMYEKLMPANEAFAPLANNKK